MAKAIEAPIAREVMRGLTRNGWKVVKAELPARKPHGQRSKPDHNPGIRLTVSSADRTIAYSVDVRDWSAERRELEAALRLTRVVQAFKPNS